MRFFTRPSTAWVAFQFIAYFLYSGFYLDSAEGAAPLNEGMFATSENKQPSGCYAVRRKERMGFEKFSTSLLISDDSEKIGADPIGYPFKNAAMIPPSKAYEDLNSNHAVDVICIGDHVIITDAIYTNGGEIFILANKLTVNAPIDTRIYFDIAKRNRYVRCDVSIGEPLENFFSSYHRKNPEGILIGDAFLAPEYPSGALFKFSSGPTDVRNGTPPPQPSDDDRLLTRSGTITVFAKEISTADSLVGNEQGNDDLCDGTAARYAFQAGGIRGGKGGLGSPSSCPYFASVGIFRCADEILTNSGVNASPGRGGDAGNIFFFKIDGTPFSQTESGLLEKSSNVKGGLSGQTKIFRTINASEIKAGVSSDICNRPSEGTYSNAQAGDSGHILTGKSNIITALQRIEYFATFSDARPTSDTRDLVLRSRTNRSVVHRSMVEFLRSQLSQAVLRAEMEWATFIADGISGKGSHNIPSIQPYTSISKELSKNSSLGLLTSTEGLVRRLSSLDITSSNTDPIYSYFRSKGGAFAVVNSDAITVLNGKTITEDLATIIETTAEQLEELANIELTLNEQLYISKRQTLTIQLDRIQKILKDLEAIPKNYGATFEDLAKSIQKAAPAIATFVGAIASDNFIAAGKAFPGAMASLNDVYSTAYGEVSDGTDSPAIRDLGRLILKLNHDMEDLTSTYAMEKNLLNEGRFYFATRELAARQRSVTRLDGRLPLGEDLIKHSFISYFAEPMRDKSHLIENLRETAVFLSGRIEYTPMLRLSALNKSCKIKLNNQQNYADCIKLPPSSHYRLVTTKIGNVKFPTWIVSPNDSTTAWPKYNAPLQVSKSASP